MAFSTYLNASCTIQGLSTSVNALGQVVRSYTIGTSQSCRFNPASGDEMPIAGRTVAENVQKLYLPSTADFVTEQSRIVSSGATYNVIRVDNFDDSSSRHHHRVWVERII